MWVQSLGWQVPLEEGTATHSSILAWRIPWTEEPGRLQSIGLQRDRHNWSDLAHTHAYMYIYLYESMVFHTVSAEEMGTAKTNGVYKVVRETLWRIQNVREGKCLIGSQEVSGFQVEDLCYMSTAFKSFLRRVFASGESSWVWGQESISFICEFLLTLLCSSPWVCALTSLGNPCGMHSAWPPGGAQWTPLNKQMNECWETIRNESPMSSVAKLECLEVNNTHLFSSLKNWWFHERDMGNKDLLK